MIVVTGGAGFIGSATLWRLNLLGRDDIVVVDHLGESEKWRNLVKRKYIDYINRDNFIGMIRSNSLPWRPEAIIHLGACSSTTEKNSDFLMDNNFHYTRDLCLYALEQGARFITASSAATYGDGSLGFSDDLEITPKLRPLNMYGYSKQLFDLWLIREHLIDSVASLKFFNVYGPNEYHKGSMKSVACKLFTEIGQSGRATLFASNTPALADGEQKRDFVHVRDCANLIVWLLLEKPQINGIRNVGTGQATTFNELAAAVFKALGKPVNIEYKAMPQAIAGNYQNFTQADMTWLKQEPYQENFWNVEQGVADYVRNYLAKADPYL